MQQCSGRCIRGLAAALVRKIKAFDAVAMKPCNLPGGPCVKQDVRGLLQAELERAWKPWDRDERDEL